MSVVSRMVIRQRSNIAIATRNIIFTRPQALISHSSWKPEAFLLKRACLLTLPRFLSTLRRRRRRNQSIQISEVDDEDEERTRESIAINDPVLFEHESGALLDKLFDALAPLRKINDPFILTRGEEDLGEFILLDIGPVNGQYTIQVDLEQRVVLLQSPISGPKSYLLAKDLEWKNTEDGHSLEGLLVRDLIRQIKGVPKL